MDKPPPNKPKVPSMADYLVHHDLKTMLEEARQDYNLASSGAPRLLNQKDIAARFAAPAAKRAGKTAHE